MYYSCGTSTFGLCITYHFQFYICLFSYVLTLKDDCIMFKYIEFVLVPMGIPFLSTMKMWWQASQPTYMYNSSTIANCGSCHLSDMNWYLDCRKDQCPCKLTSLKTNCILHGC